MKRDYRSADIAAYCAAPLAWYLLYRYALGSGIGYDALEYLVVGRELAVGASLYDFAPSKSPGIYVLVALLHGIGWQDSRVGVAALVAAILVATAMVVFLPLRRWAGAPLALAAASGTVLIALAAELNFLEPTAFVFASGLLAWMALADGPSPRREFLAGLAIGVGVLFKAVAAFYCVGISVWLLVAFGATPVLVHSLARVAVGALVPLLAAGAWFLASGQLDAFLFWSFGFPLLHYPTDARFLGKFAIKLGWTAGPLLLVAALAATRRGRVALAQPATLLACALGASAGVALYKSQASHYAFPALAFLPIVLALVAPALASILPRWTLPAAASVAVVLLVFAAWQRPDVLRRVFARPDDSWERSVATRFAAERGRPILALQGTSRVVWATGLRPLLPSIATDVQAGLLLREQPGLFEQLLDANPSAYVELEPDALRTDAPDLIEDPMIREQFDALVGKLEREFERVPDVPGSLVVWQRRGT